MKKKRQANIAGKLGWVAFGLWIAFFLLVFIMGAVESPLLLAFLQQGLIIIGFAMLVTLSMIAWRLVHAGWQRLTRRRHKLKRDERLALAQRLANEQPIVGDDGELIFRSERQQKR